ncbi:MAG: general secretion pathway protein D [Arenicella sp.]|jgi:general secretion pathway protein D
MQRVQARLLNHRRTRKIKLLLVATVLTSGCVNTQSELRQKDSLDNRQPHAIQRDLSNSAAQSPSSLNADAVLASSSQRLEQSGTQRARIFHGEAISVPGLGSNEPKSLQQSQIGDIILRFSNTPVRDVVRIVLGDYLEKSYTVADDVQGQVSLNNQNGVRKKDLLPILETLLSSVDARLTTNSNGYQIVSGALTSLPAGLTNLQLIPLRYIDAPEFVKVLDSLPVTAIAMTSGNLVAVSGTKQQIQQVQNLAKSFDVNWFKGVSVGLFPVKNTSAETIKSELLALLGQELEQDKASNIRLMAIQRSNNLMVIARQADLIEMTGDWIKRLDTVGGSNNEHFFIYQVQNGRAADLALLLEKMFSGDQHRLEQDTPPGFEPKTEPQLHDNSAFRVIADDSTNSIIVTGGPQYYHVVRQAMKKLDIVPLQVLVEARIMELTLSDGLQYGLEWFLNGSRSSSKTSSSLDFGLAGMNAIQPGFSYIIERAGEVRTALNALANDSRLKVLSSPSLMVLNNRRASILVGDEIPIPTRQVVSTISPEAPTVNEIEYRNTGILLVVTPRVNSGGMVTMDISQEVSSVANNTVSDIDAPTIQQRRVNSTVSIRSGQTVVLGGLIREQDSKRESGIPILKDIPGLGKLFSSTNNTKQRTELVVLITPRVITTGPDANAITEEYQRKFLGLKPIPLK